jgi:hypothetical protein
MPEEANVERLIEACVEAGLAARRAHAAAIQGRQQATLRGEPLTPDDVERLNKLEAAAERLSRDHVATQRPLADLNRARFKKHLDEVTHRIAERLR